MAALREYGPCQIHRMSYKPVKSTPRGRKRLFHVMWFETHLGARYEMPDMTEDQITKTHKHLDTISEESQLIVTNISSVTLVLPKRIIRKAGVGDRCFWETEWTCLPR